MKPGLGEKVESFRSHLSIDYYPIDTLKIIKKAPHRFLLSCIEINADADVVVHYYEEYDVYAINVNVFRTEQRFLKRLNFSLAHELGHIWLNHKNEIRTQQHEREADSFAGLFLMPDSMLEDCYFMDYKKLSDKFFVSERVAEIRCKEYSAGRKLEVKSKEQLLHEIYRIARNAKI